MPLTLKQHHCPGDKVWIGSVSPGGCLTGYIGKSQDCKKHQIPCKNGCAWYHLLTDPGCGKCIGATQAKDRPERNAREDAKEADKKNQENAFFNPGKDRKKPKEKDGNKGRERQRIDGTPGGG
jgi:hypothetical protein